MPGKHAELSPSKSGKWTNCAGSIAAEKEIPDKGMHPAADEGTVAHWVAAKILNKEELPEFGSRFVVVDRKVEPALFDDDEEDLPVTTFTKEMLDYVYLYVNEVDRYSLIKVEEPFSIEGLTGEEGAEGTPDAITELDGEIQIHDLKYGFTPVEAKDNTQLLMYAWGFVDYLKHNGGVGYTTKVRLVIHQPRLNTLKQHVYTLEELDTLWESIRAAALKVRATPNERTAGTHCHKYYCSAHGTCPVLDSYVYDAMETDVNNLPDYPVLEAPTTELEILSAHLQNIPAIRAWCDAVEKNAKDRAIENGEVIPRFKVVAGKKGNRTWQDDTVAEKTFRSMRIKHELMYKYSIISPTQAEKLHKEGGIGKRQWPKLKDLITQGDAKPQLVPESDDRPALEVKPDTDLLPDDLIRSEIVPVGKQVVEVDDNFDDLF